jgi:hypothetical protein
MTTIYFTNKIHVVCGCYTGNLIEFELRVKEVHKDNTQYLNEYLEFIEMVKCYCKYLGINN